MGSQDLILARSSGRLSLGELSSPDVFRLTFVEAGWRKEKKRGGVEPRLPSIGSCPPTHIIPRREIRNFEIFDFCPSPLVPSRPSYTIAFEKEVESRVNYVPLLLLFPPLLRYLPSFPFFLSLSSCRSLSPLFSTPKKASPPPPPFFWKRRRKMMRGTWREVENFVCSLPASLFPSFFLASHSALQREKGKGGRGGEK